MTRTDEATSENREDGARNLNKNVVHGILWINKEELTEQLGRFTDIKMEFTGPISWNGCVPRHNALAYPILRVRVRRYQSHPELWENHWVLQRSDFMGAKTRKNMKRTH